MAVSVIPIDATLEALCVVLRATEIRSVEVDPGKLNLPGVLVELSAVRYDLLSGATLVVRLSLVSPDVAIAQVHELLAELLAKVSTVIEPENGDVTATKIPLGEQTTLMPALQLTMALPTPPLEEIP